MVLNKENINEFLNKYIEFVDEISADYNYEDNIRHLLYLIVPSFIVKYDLINENLILRVFRDVRIYVSGTENGVVTATFNRELVKLSSGYSSNKYVVLNQYKSASLTNLIDNIVHEFNHAVNSINNEISFDDKFIKLRTGLSYLVYDRSNMKYLYKSSDVFLEEVINTEQTEEIINIINSFGNYNIDNIEFNNMLFALRSEIKDSTYISSAYYFQSLICDLLMKNKTFTPTISNLRFKGFIDDIPFLFDNVIGRNGSYIKLNCLLQEIYELEIKYSKSRFFKKRILSKLNIKAKKVVSLIEEYDSKCIYK